MKFCRLITVLAAAVALTGCKHHHRGFPNVAAAQSMHIYDNVPDVSGQAEKISNLYYVEKKRTSIEQTLDLYLPRDKKLRPYRVIIWIHGGSWLGGDKNSDVLPARMLADRYAVASLDYRFTNEAPFPAQIYDVKAAVRFLRAHAKEYHLDPDHFLVWGTSAGGYLAAMLGTTGNVKSMEGSSGWGNHSSRVQGVIDWCGPTDFNTAQSQAGPNAKMKWEGPGTAVFNLMGGRMDKESLASASPVTYASKDDPPFLIMHGDQDDAVPWAQSQEFYERLRDAGVDANYHLLRGYGHAFAAPEHLQLAKDFIDRTLAGPESR
jgi:acetyl esterase/lipase